MALQAFDFCNLNFFLAHVSQRPKWAFLINICLLSVVVVVVVVHVAFSLALSWTFHIFILFSRTTGQFSTKLGTKYPWVKGSQVCSNDGPHPTLSWDKYEIVKFFSRTSGPISTKQHPWVKGISVYSMKDHAFSQGEIIVK